MNIPSSRRPSTNEVGRQRLLPTDNLPPKGSTGEAGRARYPLALSRIALLNL